MSEPYIGEIKMVAFDFAPKGWALCDGEMLSTQQHSSLYSLLGDAFGGDQTNFALPDLRGRFPIGVGQGPDYSRGEKGGQESVELAKAQMPSHTHKSEAYVASTVDSPDPTNRYCGINSDSRATKIYSSNKTDAKMAENEVAPVGENQAHSNMPPFLSIYFIIALQGAFPPRN